MIEIKTQSGFTCEVSEHTLQDWRVIMALAKAHKSRDDAEAKSRFIKSGITCYFPNNYERLKSIFSYCAFTVCERLHGSVFSLLCHTPSYISTSSTKNKALLSQITSIAKNQNILIPYTKSAVLQKKEIGAIDSDFVNIISDLRAGVIEGMRTAF